ncbi:MAG: class I SAM-dependent methyltransferase [Pirellulaceae bacterium]
MNNSEDQLKLHQQYIVNQRKQIQALRERIDRLEKLWEFTIADPDIRWLFENRQERMDPTIPIFDPERADFHLARYSLAAKWTNGKYVADIACGTGYGSEWLLEQGSAKQVVGIDISADAIRYAAKRHLQRRN